MYQVDAVVNGLTLGKTKRFSSLKAAHRYISSLLNTYSYQIQEEYDGINGHELVCDYNTRFYLNRI
ncbi:MAG: hypothetical protein K6G38_00585 [Gammaproteobacteria bacterium]|nr:hypothetical protein [Gammaproteobacteria bacterium]